MSTLVAESLIERAAGLGMTPVALVNFQSLFGQPDRNGCTPWLGALGPSGYGRYRNTAPHRLAYELFVGPIPAGLTIHHKCYVRDCINVEHLTPMTNRDNVLDSSGPSAVNARKTECINGHPLTPENVYLDGKGRQCRMCRAATDRRRKARLMAARTHCPKGHPLAGPRSDGRRFCPTCAERGGQASGVARREARRD